MIQRRHIQSIAQVIADCTGRYSGAALKMAEDQIAQWIVRKGLGRRMVQVEREVERILMARDHKIPLTIKTARLLSEKSLKSIVAYLEQECGGTVMPTMVEDGGLVGSFRVETDTHLYRASVADTLESFVHVQ